MKKDKITLDRVKQLPNGTKIWVDCTGGDWHLDNEYLHSLNIKYDDGLHYLVEDEENTISFPYDFDYADNDMNIECYLWID